MSENFKENEDLKNRVTNDGDATTTTRTFLDEVNHLRTGNDKTSSSTITAKSERNYLSYESMKARGIDPITDGMTSDSASDRRLLEGKWKTDSKVEVMRNEELEKSSAKIAEQLIKNPSLDNKEISKILDKAADTNQMKVLLDLVNKELAKNGSTLKLDSKKETFISNVIAELGPSWNQAADTHALKLTNNGETIDQADFVGNHRDNRPEPDVNPGAVPRSQPDSNPVKAVPIPRPDYELPKLYIDTTPPRKQ